MLRLLRIRNLAVIESVAVPFGPGFTVLTGETGAGKSILVEAVGLLLGARASADLVRTGETLASIEAVFGDGGAEVEVRREISSQGRSRSFVNGAPASAGGLRELAGRLVELHGQHEHQLLLDPATHLPLLDAYGGLEALARRVAGAWETVAALRAQLERAGMDGRERAARLDLVTFQLAEIEKVAPGPGEDEELRTGRQVLASADRLQRLCAESHTDLYERDGSAVALVAGVRRRLEELAAIDPRFAEYAATAETIKTQLEDIAWFVREYGDRIDASPERLQHVEDRLAAIERLTRKFGPTLDEVRARWEALRREREMLTGADGADDLRERLDAASGEFLTLARRLSAGRRGAAPRFAAEMEALLGELAMARTRFAVPFSEHEMAPDAWSAFGIDRAEFFVSPNPGEDLRPLARIVSGGELSRIMLALKTMAARSGGRARSAPGTGGERGVRTLIFDEVDAGIGGHVADVVGQRLAELGTEFQVLCITHLPQIAARATAHLHIEKTVSRNRTTTHVRLLDDAARVDELARMIGGLRVTDAVRASAREMLAHGGAAGAKGESESDPAGESRPRGRRR
jgi:DNA repair protein RecN (Recombination protein N)